MLFEDVEQFTDFVVRHVAKWDPALDGEGRAKAVAICPGMYEEYSDKVRRISAGKALPSCDPVRRAITGAAGRAVAEGSGVHGAVVGTIGEGEHDGGLGGDTAGLDSTSGVVDGPGVVESVAPSVSPKTLENRRKRAVKADRKRRNRAEASADWRKKPRGSSGSETCGKENGVEISPLQASLEAKWAAENALAKARAEQQLEVLKARDMEALKKAERVRVRKQSERDMVAIEKAHQTLAVTGNVPGIQPGFCETVVSDGEVVSVEGLSGPTCTISPDSSASMKEFRECQKKLLDSEKKVEELEAAMAQLKFDFKIGRVLDGRGEDFTVYSESVAPEVREAIEKGLKPDQVLEDELLMGGDRKVFRARFNESYYDQFEY